MLTASESDTCGRRSFNRSGEDVLGRRGFDGCRFDGRHLGGRLGSRRRRMSFVRRGPVGPRRPPLIRRITRRPCSLPASSSARRRGAAVVVRPCVIHSRRRCGRRSRAWRRRASIFMTSFTYGLAGNIIDINRWKNYG